MHSNEKELLEKAYSRCIMLTKSHYENFSVLSFLLPKGLEYHIAAIYAYCRTVDDLGDEVNGNRLELLDQWEQDFIQCYKGTPKNIYLLALQKTIKTFELPKEPFIKLILANKMDQKNTRYETFNDLLQYCKHSANPVGELYLALFNYKDTKLLELSDFVCTGLQLVNFWQDVKRDYTNGRIYIPAEDMMTFKVKESDLAREISDSNVRSLLQHEIIRTESYFKQGKSLLKYLKSNEKFNLLLFILGGQSIIKSIIKQEYDVLLKRPKVGKLQKILLIIKAWTSVKILRNI
jgi:squalene synthase HpnC